ncbi:ABC transporter substrate-binding protein [Denitromonas iodatirespirans]|uniref:ABC transporter substrate-binding protein n=1 Tax=Denitromonas iodatirespirans TaxID=2795389 RepID=A0A944HCZ3_DENI1|nr:ABC transporter substrate-binding protein [Denitromonas iodatirespirans]MBT0961601.1 ABC transporter substrate-binding protein [Denitromonas iodatirespirans]
MQDKNEKFGAHQDLVEGIAEDLGRGVSRRSVLQAMLASGILATTAGGLLTTASNAYAQTPRRGGRIKVAVQSGSNADTLDPAKGATTVDYMRAYTFYNGLTTLDTKLAPQMSLAASFASEDAKLWIVKLRKDVRFHDGKPFTSADVVYSLLRHKKPETASKVRAVAEQFEEVKANGPDEVQIRLVAPNADLPAILGTYHFCIVRDGTTDFSTANGTGPFKCKEFRPGVRTIAVRNEEYWKPGLPYLDEIESFSIPDEGARINALLSGDVDLINPVNPRSAARITEASGVNLMASNTGNYTNLILRDDLGPVQNPDFVLAMKYLLDRQQINKVAYRGYGTIGNDQPIAPNHRYYFDGLPQRPHDPDKAKFHLQKSGMAGKTVPIVASIAATGSVDVAQLMQLSAQQIGLKLDIKQMPADGYWSNHWFKHPISFGNINPRPTADLMFTLFFKSDANWNESGWKNEQFDQLLLAARGETDDAKRKKLYGDMQVLVHEKGGIGIPQFNVSLDGYSSRLKGYSEHPLGGLMGYMYAEQVWLDA